MTVTEVKGFGRQKGHKETYRSLEYATDLLPKVKVDLYVTKDMAPRVIETIARAATTGNVGGGKIFVMDLDSVMRIRTGEMGGNRIITMTQESISSTSILS